MYRFEFCKEIIMKLNIKKGKDPILRQPTEKVDDFGLEFQHFLDDMVETMREDNGIGLAAPQVGQSKKVIVCEFNGDKAAKLKPVPLTILCNPEIKKFSEHKRNMVEGCLSFPGMEILVKRPSKVVVTGQDRYGNPIVLETDNLYARVLQHEIDHLNCTLLPDHIQETNIIFIGTGTLGVPALQALALDPQYKIKLVITGVVESSGRKSKKVVNPIEETAKKLNLPLLKVKNINDEKIVEQIRKAKPALGIMADFGQIISSDIINIPKHGIINIHPSLLPRHRGPSPVQQTILDGDKETGVSLILTVQKMDAGSIIAQATLKLNNTETSTILKDYLANGGATLLLNSLPYYLAGDLKPEDQEDSKATYSHLFEKNNGFVDENTSAIEVERKIRAFSEWPKVHTSVKGKRVQILASHFDALGNFFVDQVKPEGRTEMSYDDFVRGYHTKLTFKP